MSQREETLLQRLREQAHALLQKAGSERVPGLERLVSDARAQLQHLGEYTEAELEQAAAVLRAELRQRAAHWSEEWAEIRQWAEFDLEQVEARVLEKLLAIADPTRVELARLSANRPQER